MTCDAGFSLIETALAVALVATMSAVEMRLARGAAQATHAARSTTVAAALADQKLEQLRALAFAYDVSGATLTDHASDVTVSPERAGGGRGLQPSPADALRRNAPGYCDFVQLDGRVVGGASAPPGTAYVRRWWIGPVGAFAASAIELHVRVLDLASTPADAPGETAVTVGTVRGRWVP